MEWKETLDEVRCEVWREVYNEAIQFAKEHSRKKGCTKADDAEFTIVKVAKAKAVEIKNTAYVLGKSPEHLTENQWEKVAMIIENNNRLYRVYSTKEEEKGESSVHATTPVTQD